MESAFPAPISASFSSPSSSFEHLAPLSNGLAIRNHRYHHHSHHHRKKTNIRTIGSGSNTGKLDQSSTIPIRGMGMNERTPQPATPRANRLASSAPSTFSPLYGGPNPIARMTAGGFKPRQTAARAMMHPPPPVSSSATARRASTQVDSQSGVGLAASASRDNRVTRERSGSTTPGAPSTSTSTSKSALTAGLRAMPSGIAPGEKGKRVKV